MRLEKSLVIVVLLLVLSAGSELAPAKEAKTVKAFGLRTGYGTGPDQFVIGPQTVLGRVLGFMHFAPSIDAGFGGDTTTVLFNADMRLLSFSPPGSAAGLYLGAGPAIALFDSRKFGGDTEVGLNALAGLTFPMGSKHEYNLEVRFGIGDMPDLRILFGIMLGARAKPSAQTIEVRR